MRVFHFLEQQIPTKLATYFWKHPQKAKKITKNILVKQNTESGNDKDQSVKYTEAVFVFIFMLHMYGLFASDIWHPPWPYYHAFLSIQQTQKKENKLMFQDSVHSKLP